MKRPVDIYREMLFKEMSAFKVATTEEIIECCETYWNFPKYDEGLEKQWIARRLWAGIGLMLYGRTDKLRETFALLPEREKCKGIKCCYYYYLSAFHRIFPMPKDLELRAPALEWYDLVADKLFWDEELGVFIIEE